MGAPVSAEEDIKRGSKESANDDHYDYLNKFISANGISGGKWNVQLLRCFGGRSCWCWLCWDLERGGKWQRR